MTAKINEHHKHILKRLYDNMEFEKIISYCDEQIKLDQSNYLFFGARGRSLYELNQFYKAIEDISKSLELYPNYIKGLFNRSQCYFELEEYQLAINDIEKAHSFGSEEIFYDLLGLAYVYIDDNIKAIENFTLHLKDNLDYQFLAWRADAYFRLGQFKEAIKDYETILLSDVENNEVFNKIEKINSYEFSDNYSGENIILNPMTSFIDIGFSILNQEKTSGIYILEFNNGEYYIGQAESIQNRLKQHRKIFNDIGNVYFKSVIKDELLDKENKTIAFFERNLLRIRNLKQIGFANIFDKSCQKSWVSDLKYNYISGEKFNNEKVRSKFSDRFKILQEKASFPNLVAFLSSYLKRFVPNYLASEYNYWSITCLPKYLEKDNCISRININAVPVLSVYTNKDNSLHVMLYVSKLPFLKHLKNNLSFDGVFDDIPSLIFETRNAFESVTEGDEITIFIEEKDFNNALNNDLIICAIRLFNLRMMSNTGKENKHRRTVFHCLDLSDHIMGELAQMDKNSH